MLDRPLSVIDLGVAGYADAYEEQRRRVDDVLAARSAAEAGRASPVGVVLVLEHPPVITVSHRPTARRNLLADEARLAAAGVEVVQTDRGGDITYHGPGQLVVYPILDLLRLGLNLHGYMRLLEEAAIRACARFGVQAQREQGLTGVWVKGAKVCAFGVRVRKWVTMHGLALNVTTDLRHFDLIVPCGLSRPVTSLERELGARCPAMAEVKRVIGEELRGLVAAPANGRPANAATASRPEPCRGSPEPVP